MAVIADQQRALLARARAAIARAIGAPPVAVTSWEGPDPAASGLFVSLHRRADGDLRGCIGCFELRGSVADTVSAMAVEAATRDPRFPPVRPSELDGLEIEISLLGPLEPVSEPGTVEVGRHGLVVSRGRSRGVLLPQVAPDHGWDRETFLAHTCLKAGLHRDAWREPTTRIERFVAEVFGEGGGASPAPHGPA